MATKMMRSLLCVALLALSVSSVAAADGQKQAFTYPQCGEDTSKCCSLSSGHPSMANRGYFLANINDAETVVTCRAGSLECHLGNPRLRATSESYADVKCPDFSAIFESRSGLEVLEGVVAATETDTSEVTGQVKPAEA